MAGAGAGASAVGGGDRGARSGALGLGDAYDATADPRLRASGGASRRSGGGGGGGVRLDEAFVDDDGRMWGADGADADSEGPEDAGVGATAGGGRAEPDLYALLNVRRDAPEEEIRRAFRRSASTSRPRRQRILTFSPVPP